MPLTSEPSNASTRARISSAALFVNDRQHLVRLRVAVADQVGDAAGDDARLAGAGAGEDQQRSVEVQDRFALLRVQGVEEIHIGARVLGLAEHAIVASSRS